MKNRINTLLTLLFLSASLVFLSGCAVEETELADLGEARIRIINASPDESIINVTVNDTVRTPQPLTFSQISNYQTVAAGNSLVSTNADRMFPTNSSINFLFKKDKNYSIFVSGKITKDSLIYITLEDNFSGAADSTARVRFLNTSPNSASLEAVFSTIITDSITNIGPTAYRSSTSYQTFKAGLYNIKVRANSIGENLAVGSNLNIIAGKYYTIWMKGLRNETGIYALSPVLLTDN